MRVLGLHIAANGHNGETIRRLEGAVAQTVRLLRRISNRHSGMKEGSMIRLVQAFVISRITYVAPYLNWHVAEKTQMECLIRKAYKQAIGLPINTSTNRLLDLGLHNTLGGLIEAQNIAQYERLSKSRTGRYILEKLGIGYHAQHGIKVDVPSSLRDKLVVPPLPKNMHPEYHRGRREKRAQDVQRKFQTGTQPRAERAGRLRCSAPPSKTNSGPSSGPRKPPELKGSWPTPRQGYSPKSPNNSPDYK